MSFIQWLNGYAVIFYTLLAIVIFFGLRFGIRKGWNEHLVYNFTLIIALQYFLISPVHFFFEKHKIIIGTDISGYYGIGAFFSCVGILAFIIGYWMKPTITVSRKNEAKVLANPKKIISIVFYIVYGIVLTNMAAGGISVVNVFVGNEAVGLGARGETYFLQNFADSLIMLIILAYLFEIPGRTLLIWTVLSFFLFSLLGFRYRILLTLFGLAFAFLYKNKIRFKHVLLGIGLVLIFFYFVMLITENRYNLIHRTYAQMNYDPLTFDYNNYFDQTRGALADMAIYKVYDNPNKMVSHDYGASMFAYIFVRMIPRSLYPNKDDFYPPPQNKVQFAAYDAWWGKFSGEALLSSGCLYIAFGWPGIVFGYFIWGLLLKKFRNGIDFNNKISVGGYIAIALVSFQWITRAYFPQAVDHAVYMLAPIWVLRIVRSKQQVNLPKV